MQALSTNAYNQGHLYKIKDYPGQQAILAVIRNIEKIKSDFSDTGHKTFQKTMTQIKPNEPQNWPMYTT